MMFLFNRRIFGFQPFIFKGVQHKKAKTNSIVSTMWYVCFQKTQGTDDISHQAKIENHQLKNAKLGDLLVPNKVSKMANSFYILLSILVDFSPPIFLKKKSSHLPQVSGFQQKHPKQETCLETKHLVVNPNFFSTSGSCSKAWLAGDHEMSPPNSLRSKSRSKNCTADLIYLRGWKSFFQSFCCWKLFFMEMSGEERKTKNKTALLSMGHPGWFFKGSLFHGLWHDPGIFHCQHLR